MKIGVSMDKIIQNRQKIPVKELIPATLLKMNCFREFYCRFGQVLNYLTQYFSTLGKVTIRSTT